MRAHFGRKVKNLKDLIEMTEAAQQNGQEGQIYIVTREVVLEGEDFKVFSEDFLKDQPWIESGNGGVSQSGEVRCIRVVNSSTQEAILVNPEGYDYPRYTALEWKPRLRESTMAEAQEGQDESKRDDRRIERTPAGHSQVSRCSQFCLSD